MVPQWTCGPRTSMKTGLPCGAGASAPPPGFRPAWSGTATRPEKRRAPGFSGVLPCPQAGRKRNENHPPRGGALRRWVLFAQAERGFSMRVSMDLRSTNLNENRVALWGRGFCPAAGLPPGVVWDGDAPGETTRTRLFRGVKCPRSRAGKVTKIERSRKIFEGAAGSPPRRGLFKNRILFNTLELKTRTTQSGSSPHKASQRS